MARVGNGDTKQDGAQHRRDPQDRHDRFDDGVLRGDRLPAPATSAPQQEPRDHGYVVPPSDAAAAAGAGGRWTEQRALFLVLLGEPQDADVEETPDTEPQESRADQQDGINDHATPRRAGYPPRPRH